MAPPQSTHAAAAQALKSYSAQLRLGTYPLPLNLLVRYHHIIRLSFPVRNDDKAQIRSLHLNPCHTKHTFLNPAHQGVVFLPPQRLYQGARNINPQGTGYAVQSPNVVDTTIPRHYRSFRVIGVQIWHRCTNSLLAGAYLSHARYQHTPHDLQIAHVYTTRTHSLQIARIHYSTKTKANYLPRPPPSDPYGSYKKCRTS